MKISELFDILGLINIWVPPSPGCLSFKGSKKVPCFLNEKLGEKNRKALAFLLWLIQGEIVFELVILGVDLAADPQVEHLAAVDLGGAGSEDGYLLF